MGDDDFCFPSVSAGFSLVIFVYFQYTVSPIFIQYNPFFLFKKEGGKREFTCMWSAPSNLWLHLRASWRYLSATWTFPKPSSIIATLIYVAAVFGCEGPQVRCKRYNARLTYLEKEKDEVKYISGYTDIIIPTQVNRLKYLFQLKWELFIFILNLIFN